MNLRPRAPLPTVGAAAAGFVLATLAVALPGEGASVFLVRLVELLLAGGAAYLLDDGAALMTVVTPRTLWRRRAPTLIGGMCVLVVAWVSILLLLRWQHFALSPAVLSTELVVLGAIAVALAAVLIGRGEPEPGSRVAPIVGLAGVTALIAEPLLRAPIFLPTEVGHFGAGWWAWSAVGVFAVTVTLMASRDPASRWRR